MLDGKTFTVIVWEQYWLCLDSHCRSVSGLNALDSSLLAIGQVEACWLSTLGELMTRGGQDAPYQVASAGGYWSLQALMYL